MTIEEIEYRIKEEHKKHAGAGLDWARIAAAKIHAVLKLEAGSGDIECESILGDVQTGSGDVSVMGNITGSVRTGSGDIKYRK
jgi:hypothetical protein